MSWKAVASYLEALGKLDVAVRPEIPTDGERMTEDEHRQIIEQAQALRTLGGDLALLAETYHPLSEHERQKAMVSAMTDEPDCARLIKRDGKGREVSCVLSSAKLGRTLELRTDYDAAGKATRTVREVS